MELFFILFLILVIVGTIAWAVSVWTGPRPRHWQGEVLLGGLTLSVAGFTFLIAMSNPVERSFWMIPSSILLAISAGAFGWLEPRSPMLLRLCQICAVAGLATCLWVLLTHDVQTADRSVPAREFAPLYQHFALGFCGYSACLLLVLKLQFRESLSSNSK